MSQDALERTEKQSQTNSKQIANYPHQFQTKQILKQTQMSLIRAFKI